MNIIVGTSTQYERVKLLLWAATGNTFLFSNFVLVCCVIIIRLVSKFLFSTLHPTAIFHFCHINSEKPIDLGHDKICSERKTKIVERNHLFYPFSGLLDVNPQSLSIVPVVNHFYPRRVLAARFQWWGAKMNDGGQSSLSPWTTKIKMWDVSEQL